jgi:enoyl-CoA hydratase
MSATEARQWGLVNRLTLAGGALAGARALAAEISANSPMAVRMTKRIMVESPTWPADQQWVRQREILEQVIASDDAREGSLAFSEKRAPRWTGT